MSEWNGRSASHYPDRPSAAALVNQPRQPRPCSFDEARSLRLWRRLSLWVKGDRTGPERGDPRRDRRQPSGTRRLATAAPGGGFAPGCRGLRPGLQRRHADRGGAGPPGRLGLPGPGRASSPGEVLGCLPRRDRTPSICVDKINDKKVIKLGPGPCRRP